MHVFAKTELRWSREWLITTAVCFLDLNLTWITVVILELIHARSPDLMGWVHLLEQNQSTSVVSLVNLNNWADRTGLSTGDISFKCLPYQLSMVVYMPTMVVTGNGKSGFDSGEGAWEMATTSKEGSRRVTYPLSDRGGSDEKYRAGGFILPASEWEQCKRVIE